MLSNKKNCKFITVSHEPLEHRLRTGNSSKDEIQLYKKEHTKENVDRLAFLGVNSVLTYCYKGFGLKFEKETIDEVAAFTEYCHQKNIKVSVYFQSFPVYHETLLAEDPDAAKWLQSDYWGKPISWGWQNFRHWGCPNSDDFILYLEKILKYIAEKVKPDFIMFDNVSWNPAPTDCHCENCKRKFRGFLAEKYNSPLEKPNGNLRNKIGIESLKYVDLPHYDPFYPPDSIRKIKDPVLQDWIIFRTKSLAGAMERLYNCVKKNGPDIEVGANLSCGFPYFNSAFIWGGYLPYFKNAVDTYSGEEPFHAPFIYKNGALTSHIRTYKMGHTLKTTAGNSEAGSDPKYYPLYMANAFAFNRTDTITAGYILAKDEDILEQKKYFDFLNGYKEYYLGAETVSKVAVLRSNATLAFSSFEPLYSTVMLEQTLLLSNIPFDIIFDEQLADLSKYKVLVLADVECLSDAQLAVIEKFVSDGGSVLVTENTSFYDEKYRPRTTFGLAKIFDHKELKEILSIAPPHNVPQIKKIQIKNMLKTDYGKGRAVYIPKVIPSIELSLPRDPYFPFKQVYPEYVALPENYKEIESAIEWLLGEKPAVEIEAKGTVLGELTKKYDSEELVLHLVNFDVDKTKSKIKVTLNIKKDIREILNISFEHDEKKKSYKNKGNSLVFEVDGLKTYEAFCIK